MSYVLIEIIGYVSVWLACTILSTLVLGAITRPSRKFVAYYIVGFATVYFLLIAGHILTK